MQRFATPRRLRIERLEPRRLLAGETLPVNFQPAEAEVPHGDFVDSGEVRGARGKGQAPLPFDVYVPGFAVEVVSEGYQLPVNIAFVPNPGAAPGAPRFYVTELYGTIKVVTNDGTIGEYATDLLNFNPTGNFPGSGEQGLTGLVVEPETGDVIVTRLASEIPFDDESPHHPQVVRFTSNDGGLTAATETVLLNMVGESQGQSHQISNISIGPDGKLYVHNGDGFTTATALDLDSFRGKVLRMSLDGSASADNPFYDASDGIHARDYVFAYGFRNPFGGAWRAADGAHYEVENGPSVDRLARVDAGASYGWNGTNSSMMIGAIYNWQPAHAPVNISFIQPETFDGSGFPVTMMDRAFVSESGPTYAAGPQSRGKRIVFFELDGSGGLVSGPTNFVEYAGVGRATVVGLAAGPDGLYFTDFYKDLGAQSPIEAGARVLRVRYLPSSGDFDLDGHTNGNDFLIWQTGFGLQTGATFADGDANGDGAVDGEDYLIWQSHYGSTGGGGSVAAAVARTAVGDADRGGLFAGVSHFADLRSRSKPLFSREHRSILTQTTSTASMPSRNRTDVPRLVEDDVRNDESRATAREALFGDAVERSPISTARPDVADATLRTPTP